MFNNKNSVKIPGWLFIIPFVIVLTLEFFSKELTAGGLSEGTLKLLNHSLYIIAFILIGFNWWQNRKNNSRNIKKPESTQQTDSYNTKKIITIIFLFLSFIVPVIGIVGVAFMWIWMRHCFGRAGGSGVRTGFPPAGGNLRRSFTNCRL